MGKVAKVLGGGGSAPKDNSAAIARQQEEERQARIREGKTSIDNTFNDIFTDDYFSGLSNAYTDYYYPQIDDQYSDAIENVKFALARQGLDQSTAGAERLGKLQERYDQQRTAITDRAQQSSADARANVERERTSLYDLNSSAADPSLIASRASAQAGSLQAPQVFSPLANVFADLINQGAGLVSVQNQTANPADRSFNQPVFDFSFGSGSGSGQVVR